MERSATSKRPHGAYTDQLLPSASRSPHCRPNACPRPAPSPCYNTCAIAHGQVATSVCESPTNPESGREGRDNNALLAGVLIAMCHTPPTVHRCLQTELQHQHTDSWDMRHSVPSGWQATATTREHNLADRPGSIDRKTISFDPHLVIMKPSFPCLAKSTLTNRAVGKIW